METECQVDMCTVRLLTVLEPNGDWNDPAL